MPVVRAGSPRAAHFPHERVPLDEPIGRDRVLPHPPRVYFFRTSSMVNGSFLPLSVETHSCFR